MGLGRVRTAPLFSAPLFAAFLLFALPAAAQRTALNITVADENGVAVAGAAVSASGPAVANCRTDYAGRCALIVPPGSYHVVLSRDGFYTLTLPDVRAGQVNHVDATLTHVQEVKENVEVTAAAPGIEPQQVPATQSLGSREIINVPFPVTRDIRQALPFIPGVIRDPSGQVHVAGAETWETINLLDGFNISHPLNGNLDLRFSTDAVRAIDVENSRYSAEYGPSSAGLIAFATANGDDRFRFSATNFVPSLQFKKGTNFDKWTPRATFSGPIVKGRAWFLLAPDGEYDNNIVKELPAGADRNPVWRISNLAKAQVNLTQRNILTGSLVVNDLHSKYDGLSILNPRETTTVQNHSAYVASVKDQHYFASNVLLEVGLATTSFHDTARPLGIAPFLISPSGTRGNYFKTTDDRARRSEAIVNVYLPPHRLAGAHELRFGGNITRLDDTQSELRRTMSILRADQSLYSTVAFSGTPSFGKENVETGFYAQDRWTPAGHVLLEYGARVDRDRIVRRWSFSPRIGATWMLNDATKLAAGVGLFHDPTQLELITRPEAGARLQTFYAADGVTPLGAPLETRFTVDQRTLAVPRFLNWSLSVERRLPAALYVTAEFLMRRGSRGFTYQNVSGALFSGDYRLVNTREDRYRAVQFSVRRNFGESYEIMLAYTRSRARSNQVLDYSLDNPIFSPQAAGPLAWDAPNKLVTWGFLPVPKFKKWQVGYSGEWRTGFPFIVVNQNQQVVGPPDSRRFPDYFSLNVFLERRFTVRHYNLALRGGFENITGRRNPATVNNNIDSPQFLQFSNFAHRSFTARIRFLGRK